MGKNSNGEGCIYSTIAKQKRKKILAEECNTCKNCKDRTDCNNRVDYNKCTKCENCKTECLKYCDRFYCYERYQAQITINGKQTTVANTSKRRDAVEKKIETEAQVQTKTYIKKNGIKLLELIKKVDEEKYTSGNVSENTISRNQYNYTHIKNSILSDIPVQKITHTMLQEFLNTKKYLSQSEIEKIVGKLRVGFNRAVLDKIISYADNPMLRVGIPISDKNIKEIEAFEVPEQKQLIEYILTNNLIKNSICEYDQETIKNIILLSLMLGTRIGELGAIDYTEHINLKENNLIIERTLTKDRNGKIIMGIATKTGKCKKRKKQSDKRIIPFNIFDEKLVLHTIKKQINIAKGNLSNKEHLLFTKKDGKYINHAQITSIFKRICREAKIKQNLIEGCHIHMCRHTFATRLIEANIDLKIIAKLMGHSSTRQIEKTYGHILEKYIDDQLNKSNYIKNEILTKSIKNLIMKKA